jgi:hypothetical protein
MVSYSGYRVTQRVCKSGDDSSNPDVRLLFADWVNPQYKIIECDLSKERADGRERVKDINKPQLREGVGMFIYTL